MALIFCLLECDLRVLGVSKFRRAWSSSSYVFGDDRCHFVNVQCSISIFRKRLLSNRLLLLLPTHNLPPLRHHMREKHITPYTRSARSPLIDKWDVREDSPGI